MRRIGLTLIEVLISILILAIILTVMMGIFQQGFSIARKSKERSCAYDLTLRTMEEYSNWSALVALAGNPPINGTYTPSSVSLNNVCYSRSVVVSDGPVDGTQLKGAVVTVTWPCGSSSPRGSFSLSTYVANY